MSRRIAVALIGVLLLVTAAGLSGPPPASGSTTGQVPFTATKIITRDHLVDGADVVVDHRTFSLSVSDTKNLRGYQEIDVRWSGAHPTGGIIADQNSGDAKQEEYPVVLLECRGVDSTSVPVAQQLDPSTCWTATSGERFQDSFNTPFPPWRIDRYATPAQRQAVVGAPATRPAACSVPSPSEYWLPFKSVDGTVYAGGSGGCAGMAPEAANVGGLSLPSNTTYGVTHADGTGAAQFDIWTDENNASLGCSDTVACSLVAVPVLGISCDVAAADLPPADRAATGAQASDADALCRRTGHFQPGQLVTPNGSQDAAVSGALWWAGSNWRNRITVPLDFAPPSNVCDVVGGKTGIDVYGSELLTQAALQWAPHFCVDAKLFRFRHVQTSEPQARTLLKTGTIEGVFASDVPDGGYGKPVVNAPVALTGFAIAFSVDDAKGERVADLRLTPRLLAKLLTESYPAINAMKQEYQPLSGNPLNISLDPEFQALNPNVPKGVTASQSASTLLALSSDSDVMHAITAYINADPEARKWLDGTPDPWGMVVNPNYRSIALPTASWPLLDTFQPPLLYGSGTNDCLFNDPVAYLPLVAAPVARMADIAQKMQFSLANSQTVCYQPAEGTSAGEKLVGLGRQTPGFRFMLGVTSLADAHRYGLETASLQTQVAADAPVAFTSATGRSFVAPTDASVKAAADLLQPDATTQSWPIPYGALRTDPAGADAYPGTMVVYAEVPTSGLPAADATSFAQLLRFAASDGQKPGSGNGQLPDGYLPLTEANGVGALAAYTVTAADAVAAQDGTVPPVAPAPAGPDTTPTVASPTGGTPFCGPGGGSGSLIRRPARSSSSTAAAATAPAAAVTPAPPADRGTTVGAIFGMAGGIVPLLLALSAAAGLGAMAFYGVGRRRARR